MTKILLEVLNDSDLNWMVEAGKKVQLDRDEVIIRQGETLDNVYIVLDGTLSASIHQDQTSGLGRAFAALSDDQDLQQEINQFSSGEVIGETVCFGKHSSPMTVKSVSPATILALPHERLKDKLTSDQALSSRFYQAIANLLAQRLQQILERFSRRRGLQISPIQDGPLLFGELHDSDVDWIIHHCSVEDVSADQIVIQSGRSIMNVYIVLQGLLSISISEGNSGKLNSILTRLQDNDEDQPMGREVARAGPGEIVGETALLMTRLSFSTVKAIEASKVLMVPTQTLSLHLQQDLGMAARFYRVLAILLSGRLENLISRLGYGKQTYQAGAHLSDALLYADEIDIDLIDNLSLGGARFDWMLKRLHV